MIIVRYVSKSVSKKQLIQDLATLRKDVILYTFMYILFDYLMYTYI